MAVPPAQVCEAIPDQLTLPQIEQEVSTHEAGLEERRKALLDVETELKGRAARRARIPEQTSAAKERLADINSKLQAAGGGDDGNPAGLASRAMLIVRRRTAEQEISCCEKELRAYEARTELLPASRDLDTRQVALAEQELKQWQEVANRRRKQEAEQQARQALRQAGQAHPVVKALAARNAELAEMRKSLVASITETTARLEEVKGQLTALKENFTSVQQKVETVGLTNEIGLLLRNKRETLPNVRELRRNAALQQQTIGQGQLEQMKLYDERRPLADLEAETQVELRRQHLIEQSDERSDLATAVRQALSTRRDYLDALNIDYDKYYSKLVDLYAAEQLLIKETERYARYIDERVLWIASTTPLGVGDAQSRRCTMVAGWSAVLGRDGLDIVCRRGKKSGSDLAVIGTFRAVDLLAASASRARAAGGREGGPG